MARKDRRDFEVMSLAAAEAPRIKKEIWMEVLSCQQKQPLLLSLFPYIVFMAMDQIPFILKSNSQAGDAAHSSHTVILTKPTRLGPFLTLYVQLHFESIMTRASHSYPTVQCQF